MYFRPVASVRGNTVNVLNILRWYALCKNIRGFYSYYCKTLNVSVPFISRISRAKQNREIKGREYQLQAKNRTKLLQYFELYGFNSPK